MTSEKYDICILIDVVDTGDHGKIYGMNHTLPFYGFISPTNATRFNLYIDMYIVFIYEYYSANEFTKVRFVVYFDLIFRN